VPTTPEGVDAERIDRLRFFMQTTLSSLMPDVKLQAQAPSLQAASPGFKLRGTGHVESDGETAS
jgi:hypothetical protein